MSKRDFRASPLSSFGKAKKTKSPLAHKTSPLKYLRKIQDMTLKFLKEAESQIEVFDALCNMDAEIKYFRETYYPSMTDTQRLKYEYMIRDMVRKLEAYAKRKLRMLRYIGDKILEW